MGVVIRSIRELKDRSVILGRVAFHGTYLVVVCDWCHIGLAKHWDRQLIDNVREP